MQTYANHRRWWAPWHFFAMPVLGVNLIVVTVQFAQNPGVLTGWNLVVWVALIVALVGARYMTLRVQDRLICLEERTRLGRLLPPDLRERIPRLRRRQLIALRFAPDAEIPDLTQRIFAGEIESPSDIKRAISEWRADHLRV